MMLAANKMMKIDVHARGAKNISTLVTTSSRMEP
jgi:hypothetical protein